MRLVASFLLFFGLSVAHAQPTFDLKKGATSFGGVCVACHAADGNSAIPANPKLAGQHPEYLAKQLREYKSGKRANAIMAGFAATLSEQQMLDIAHWLATQPPKPGFATDAELAAQGERIYRGGIADRQIASCAGCHGPAGAGIPAQFPRLAGQHAEYTKTQLSAFRSGARANNSVMNMVAAKLNDKEIEALAQYLAGLR
jgi:cytochrome c553